MKRVLTAAVIAGALVAPASAYASDNINHRQARAYTLDAAKENYSGNGVAATSAVCGPQFIRANNWLPSERLHRWVYSWDGYVEDDYVVYGHARSIGHSGNTHANLAPYDGLRWM